MRLNTGVEVLVTVILTLLWVVELTFLHATCFCGLTYKQYLLLKEHLKIKKKNHYNRTSFIVSFAVCTMLLY